MRRPMDWLLGLTLSDLTRRALDEVAADWQHEQRAAATLRDRVSAMASAASGIGRVLTTATPLTDGGHPLRNLGRDYRYAWRRLRATPVFTLFAILTLALGIGVTTGIHAAVRAVLSPPAGLVEPDRLVTVTRQAADGSAMAISWPEFQDLQAQQTTLDGLAGWRHFRAVVATNDRSQTSFNEAVSGAYFQTLGVHTALGRAIQPTDDRPDAAPVAVISHATWRVLFDADTSVLGRTVKMNGVDLTIVGVANPAFTGLFNGGLIPTAIWTPMSVMRQTENTGLGISFDPADRERRWIRLLARLAPGRLVEEARAEITAISTRLNTMHSDADASRPTRGERAGQPSSWGVTPLSAMPKVMGAGQVLAPLTAALMTAVILVLLVACTNLANLMLARVSGRRQESAVRLALGASRWRLVREGLAESGLLALAGGVLGLGVAHAISLVLSTELAFTRGVSLQLQPQLDFDVLAGALVFTLLALAIAGLAPALQASRADVRGVIATDSLASSPRWRVRRYLIALQVGVSVLLVTLAGLCVAQVRSHLRLDRGIETDRLAIVEMDFGSQRIGEADVRRIVDGWLARVGQQPGVAAVAAVSGLPGVSSAGVSRRSAAIDVVGQSGRGSAALLTSTPGVFDTLGVTLLRGRGLDARDTEDAVPVAVIGDRTAAALFGSADALGQQILVTPQLYYGEPERADETRVIVGIAREPSPRDEPRRDGVVYVPLAQRYERMLVLAARATTDASSLLAPMRQALRDVAPDAAPIQATTGQALVGQDVLFFQVVAGIATILGGMAMVVALAGLYGILSFIVAGRTREIGIRLAIGAEASAIRRLVLREGLSPVWIGLVIGLGAGVLVRIAARSIVVRMVPAVDVTILVAVPLLFVAAGVVACYLPALRASRVDPQVALRSL